MQGGRAVFYVGHAPMSQVARVQGCLAQKKQPLPQDHHKSLRWCRVLEGRCFLCTRYPCTPIPQVARGSYLTLQGSKAPAYALRYPLSGEAFAIKFVGKGIAGQKPPVAWAYWLLAT